VNKKREQRDVMLLPGTNPWLRWVLPTARQRRAVETSRTTRARVDDCKIDIARQKGVPPETKRSFAVDDPPARLGPLVSGSM
jgi:hypothetical protein